VSTTIASLNLHCGIDRHEARYSVKSAIAALDTDVVLVQENWRPDGGPSLAELAAADCGYREYAEFDIVTGRTLAELEIATGPAPDETGAWGLAMMSRLPWRHPRTVALGSAPGDVVGERAAQIVEIAVEDGILRVVNVHLTHRLVHGPAQLRRLTDALASRATPTVMGGDFNMCRPTIHLARPYRPAVRGRTFPAHLPLAQLDHLLIGPGVAVTDGRVGPGTGSDHRPVSATVALSRS
jgi:endonuclease/exonuclease/phosphatase family metal-dependent hydrolase